METGSVTSPEGEEGWLFVLLEDETKVATVEVYSDRLVLVHASFSRDAVNAGKKLGAIFKELSVSSRTQAILAAQRLGLKAPSI